MAPALAPALIGQEAAACALLGLDIVLNIYEQADLSVLLLRLSGRSGASGDSGGKGFFGIIHAQRFQAGKPFLTGSAAGNVFAPLDLIAFFLQAAEQILKICGGRD